MYDVIIIGAGVTGTACARELSRYEAKICVLEKEEDVCCGTSKANSAIVQAGYDAAEGSLKAKLNVRGNLMMEELSEKLDFPFKRNGSLVICLHKEDFSKLETLYERGRKNGVKGLQILYREQVKEMEPNITDEVVYGVVGVCEVEKIDTPPIKGISGDYYFLQPVFDSKGIIYSPVDSNKVMIRGIMTVKECDKLKERARNCKKDGELSEKVTPMQYDEHMKSQDALKLMHLIRALYVIKNERAKDLRKMKSADSRMLLAARKLLYGEFAAVYNQTFDEVAEEMDAFLSVD